MRSRRWGGARLLLTFFCLILSGFTHAAIVDIVVNQSDSPDPIGAGGLLTYTIVVSNNGPDDATGVVLTDTIPGTVTFSSVSTTKGACVGTSTITCTIGSLTIGESATVLIRVVPTVVGTLTNTVTSTRNEPDSNAANNADTDITTVQTGTDLSITKTDSADPVSQGDSFSYALTARNNGPYALGASDTLTITDNVPSGIRVTAVPSGTGWSCLPASGYPMNGPFALTCTRTGAVAIAANAPVLTVPVMALSLGTITNQVTLSSSIRDDNTANNNATQSTTVNQASDAAITKGVNQTGNLGLGQTYTYTLSPTLIVGTTGTITVTDNFPAGAELTATPTGTGWTCTPNAGFPLAGPQVISCTRASASNTNPTPLSLNDITVSFRPTATGALNNAASINPGATDPVPGNNTSSTVSNTVINDAAITKTVSQAGNLGQNQAYTYTLAPVLNMGTTAGTITVTDNLPAGVTLTSAPTGALWSCTPNSGFPLAGPVAISCTRAGTGNAGPAALSLNNISFGVRPTATGALANTATINSGATDTTAGNNSSTVNNTVINDLVVAKSVSAASPLATGSTYTYTLSPSLAMGDTGGVITLVDNFPAGANLTSNPTGTGWTCGVSPAGVLPLAGPRTITCTKPTAVNAGPGSSSLSNVTYNFSPTAVGTLVNNVTISSPATDTSPANNTASTSRTVVAPGVDMQVTKTVSNTSRSVGATYSYTLTVRNNGPLQKPTGQLVTVTDIAPTGITFNSASGTGWTCSSSTGSFPIVGNDTDYVQCTRTSSLNANTNYPTITVGAVGTAGGVYTNTGTVIYTGDTDATNDSSSVNITITSNYDLVISKSDSAGGYGPDPVAVGDTVDYRLRVTNNGPTNVPGGVTIAVTDTLPANTTYISGTGVTAGHAWTCPAGPISGSPGPVTVVCTRTVTGIGANTFNNGVSSDIRFILRADSGAGTTMTNNARVDVTAGSAESNTTNNTANVNTAVRGSADLSITKTASVASLLAGQNLTYTVTVTNNGPDATGINNVSVTDNMTSNPGATFVSVTPAQPGWNCNNLINLVCDYNNSLLSGQSVSFNVTVTPTVVGSPRNNTATVGLRQNGVTFPVDPDAANNSATVGVNVLNSVDLFVNKTDAPDPVRAGTDLTYVVTVGNTGPGTATPVTLTDTLPAELILYSINPSGGGSCTTTPASTTYTSANTNVSPRSAFTTLNCTWANLAAASQQTVTVIGRPTNAAATAGSISNTASVSHGNSGTVPDINALNNSVTQNTTVLQAQIDLLVNKVDTPDPVALGTTTTYNVTVTNQGPSAATNIVLTENLPSTYVSFVSATPSQGTCGAPVANVMTCNLGNLEVANTASIAIVMNANIVGVDTNSVSVTADEFDTNLVNNSVSENTTVQLGADLQLSKLATPDPVIAGNSVFYYLRVRNTGPANSAVTLVDTFPAGIGFVSAVASQGSCSHAAGVVTCPLGMVPYNGFAEVTLVGTALTGGVQLNSATVTGSSPDPSPVDNTATAPVTVVDGMVSGRVFRDDGAGAGTANDGLQGGDEAGLPDVIVGLTDCGLTTPPNTVTYLTDTTDALGDYSLIVPAALATGAVLCVVEYPVSGYISTGGSPGTTAGSYTLATDTTQFTYTDGVAYSGVDFADVSQSRLYSNQVRNTTPGAILQLPHIFEADSDGIVTFSLNAVSNPGAPLWSEVLYQDANCDALLDPSDPPVTGPFVMTPGGRICLLIKEFVPVQANDGARNTITLTATFVYDNLVPAVSDVLVNQDQVSVSRNDTLFLYKSVDKAAAQPGDVITYTVQYRNEGVSAISNLNIYDAVPAFTHSPSAVCILPLPSGLTGCTPVIANPAIEWNFSGVLLPGAEGAVSFTVTVDN